MSEVEKSVAEQLKELMDAQVAEKADRTDLEGLAKEEALAEKADKADLEGVVKSEQLEEIKTAHAEELAAAKQEINEMREEFAAKMASASAVITKDVKPMFDFVEITKDNGEVCNNLTIDLHTKANNDAGGTESDIAGRRVDSARMYYTAEQFNPWAGQYTVLPVSGGSIKLPNVSGLTFAEEDTVPVNRSLGQGTIASSTVVIKNWTNYTQFSKPHFDDLPGLREMVTGLILQKHSVKQAEETASAIKTSVNSTSSGTFARVLTGVADALPASNDVIGKMAELLEGVDVAYRAGGMFMVSPELYTLLLGAGRNSNSGFAFDPATAQARIFGYPMMINSYLDDGTGDAEVSALFGDFGRGVAMCERRSLSIDEFPQAQPGYVTYYSDARWIPSVWDDSAVAGLESNAA